MVKIDMTQDEIIELAIQARLVEKIDECHRAIRPKWIVDHDITTYVEAFAKLVAAKEREEIAQFIEHTNLGLLPEETALHYARLLRSYSTAIRARGEA